MAQVNQSIKQKLTHRQAEQTCGCQGEEEGRGMNWESGVSRCKPLHLEWIRNKVLLYSIGNYIQSLPLPLGNQKSVLHVHEFVYFL